MIILRNKAALTTPVSLPVGSTVVPFDTLVANTNNATAWNASNNSVTMQSAGRFNTKCSVVVSSTAGGTATLSLLANGTAIAGDYVEATIEAAGTQTLTLDVPVSVVASSGSDSYLQWQITCSAISSIENAFADIQGIR